MRLKRLLLVNYCQHARTEVYFNNGLTAVVGPNGIGKSNIVYGIKFALIGESDQDGVKADNIRDIAPAGEHAYVELDFSHAGIDYRIVRKLRPTSAKSELWAGGGDAAAFLGDNAVTEEVLKVLGVEKSAIQELMIVPQESMFGFLDRTQAKRLESWQRVLRLMVIEIARQGIAKNLQQFPVAVGPSAETMSNADIAVGEAETRLANARISASASPPVAEITARIERLVKQADDYRHYQTALAAAQAAETAVTNAVTFEQSHATQLSLVLGQLQQQPPPVDTAPLRAQLAALQAYQQLPAFPPRPEPQAIPVEVQQDAVVMQVWNETPPEHRARTLRDRYTTLQNRLDAYREFQLSFKNGICPTCTQRVETPPAMQLDEAATLAHSLRFLSAAGVAQLNVDLENRWLVHERQVRGQHDAVVNQLTQAGLTPSADASQNAAMLQQLQQALSAAAVAATQRSQLEHAFTQAKTAHDHAKASLLQRQVEHQQALTRLQQLPVVDPVPQDQIVATRSLLTQVQLLHAAVTTAESALKVAQERQSTLAQLAVEAEKGAAWHNYATRLASWLAPGGLPKLVMHEASQALVAGINERLRLAGADFQIEISPEMEFISNFDDGRRQPDKRLSQGQKDLLGLTFRLALTELTTEGLDVLVIDEPTADLDDRYRDRVLAVIDHLRESAVGSGLQVVIVTHSKALADRCDAIVDLTPGANA